MWQLSKSLIYCTSPVLVLTLVSACSQADSPPQVSSSPSSPAIEQKPVAPLANSTPGQQTPEEKPLQSRRSQASPAPKTPQASSLSGSSTTSTIENKRAVTQSAASPPSTEYLRPTFTSTPRMAGFSADGQHYIYVESSRDTGAGVPKSTIQVVNVSENSCAKDGCLETHYSEVDGDLAIADTEKEVLQKTWKVRQELKLTPPVAGKLLPVVTRSRSADGSELVRAQLDADQVLQVRLRQKQIAPTSPGEQSQPIRAAMQLDVTYNGQTRSLDSIDNFRDWVLGYSIREVRLSPDGKRVAVLITATRPTFEGTLGTTLVRGFNL